MSPRQALLVALALLVMASAACTGTPALLGPREPALYDPTDRIDYTATECGAQVMILLPVLTNNRVTRAMELIEKRAGERYIASVRLRERWTYLVFGEIYCTDVIAATFGPPRAGPLPPPADTGR